MHKSTKCAKWRIFWFKRSTHNTKGQFTLLSETEQHAPKRVVWFQQIEFQTHTQIFLFDKTNRKFCQRFILLHTLVSVWLFAKINKDHPRSPFSQYTTSSASFDVLGNDLPSSLDDDFQCDSTWKDVPFIEQKVVGVRVEITLTSYRNGTITYTAVIAGYIDRPRPGQELVKLEKDDKVLTSSGLYVLLSHNRTQTVTRYQRLLHWCIGKTLLTPIRFRAQSSIQSLLHEQDIWTQWAKSDFALQQ